MLAGLARTCYRHRRIVVALWMLVFVLAIAVGGALKGESATSGRLPNTDSQAAYDTLKRDFPQRHGDEAQIVFADVTKNRPAIDAYLAKVAKVKGVIEVEPIQVSRGGKIAVAPITTASRFGHAPARRPRPTSRTSPQPLEKDGVQVEFAGNWFGEARHARERDRRHPRRDHRAAHRVRLGDRDGAADPHRAHRHRHLARRRRASSPTSSRLPTSRRRSPR